MVSLLPLIQILVLSLFSLKREMMTLSYISSVLQIFSNLVILVITYILQVLKSYFSLHDVFPANSSCPLGGGQGGFAQ